MAALDHALFIRYHIVAQVVEAHFVIRAVGYVGFVHRAALGGIDVVDDESDGEPEVAVDLAHPFAVALGEVVVDGDDMHAVKIRGKRRDEGLAFAGLHLGDLALVKDDAADHLHGIVPHIQHAPGRLRDGGERFRQDAVELLAVGDALLELRGHTLQLRFAHCAEAVRKRERPVGEGLRPLDLLAVISV